MERALTSDVDVLGAFFDDMDDDQSKATGQIKGDKITPLFTF